MSLPQAQMISISLETGVNLIGLQITNLRFKVMFSMLRRPKEANPKCIKK